MEKKYANPPIIEAACEFRFSPDSKWDLAIPGLLYEKVRLEFPTRKQHLIQEVDVVQLPEGLQPQNIRIEPRILFLSEDEKTFIQIGQNFLALNCLKPYPTWDAFRPKIRDVYAALTSIVEVKGLQRIGLRYINRIEVASPSVKLENYFEFRPFLGQRLPQAMTAHTMGCAFPFLDGRDSCNVQLINAVPEKPGMGAFLLDIDYFLAQPQTISASNALEWVEEAHEQVENIFEGCITEDLRKLFQEVK